MIRVKVKKIGFYEKQVLQESELSLRKGNLTVLKGPSGSGKSTILNAIAYKNKFLDELLYDGEILNLLDEHEYKVFLAKHVAFLTQDIKLLEDLNVSAHIALYKELFHPNQDLEECKRLLEIDSLLERYPLQLSGGEQRRVGLLLAVLKDSEVLVLDEPTASLDEVHTEGVLQLIKQLTQAGKTIFVTSHDQRVIKQADVVYAIENKSIRLIKDKVSQSSEYKKICHTLDLTVVQPYLKQSYAHHKTYHRLCRILTVLCISFVALCSQFEQYVSIRNGASLSNSISNQMVVYRQNQGFRKEYNFDGIGLPITEEEAEVFKKLDHVKNVRYRADVDLGDDFALYAKERYDGYSNFDLTVKYPDQQKKTFTRKEYNSIILSSYMEEENYRNAIKEDFHQPGVFISSVLAGTIKNQNYDLKDTKLALNLLMPAYQIDGQYIVDGIPVTASVCTRVPVELNIAGVLNDSSMGVPILHANAIYLPQKELEAYVEKSRKEKGEVVISAKEEDPITYALKRMDFYHEITDEIKQLGYTSFYTMNYTPWKPAAYTIVVDEASNVDDVIQEITAMGYDVLYEDLDYHALSQGTKQLQILARIVSVVCLFIILIVYLLMNYNDKVKEKKVSEFFFDIGFEKQEVLKIKKRKYIRYAKETGIYTMAMIAIVIQIDRLFLHVGLSFHVFIFVIAALLVTCMEIAIPMLFEWRDIK